MLSRTGIGRRLRTTRVIVGLGKVRSASARVSWRPAEPEDNEGLLVGPHAVPKQVSLGDGRLVVDHAAKLASVAEEWTVLGPGNKHIGDDFADLWVKTYQVGPSVCGEVDSPCHEGSRRNPCKNSRSSCSVPQ